MTDQVNYLGKPAVKLNNYGLRACPCCGEFVGVVLRCDRFANMYVYCTKCGLSTKFYESSKMTGGKTASKKARDAWNMRNRPRIEEAVPAESEAETE